MKTDVVHCNISLISSQNEKCFGQKLQRKSEHTFFFFFFENGSVYEVKWKNIVEPRRPQMTIFCTRIACWISKSTNTHSEYVILIAFPLQQWLREQANMSRFTYIARHAASHFAQQKAKFLCIRHFSSYVLCASDTVFFFKFISRFSFHVSVFIRFCQVFFRC